MRDLFTTLLADALDAFVYGFFVALGATLAFLLTTGAFGGRW